MRTQNCIMLMLMLFMGCIMCPIKAQNQKGFISLNCGSPLATSYTEKTKLNYTTDSKYIDTGVSKKIKPEFQSGFQQQMWTLRSFPTGIRNCYQFNLTKGDRYLIRANFLYGNYDSLDVLPTFDLHVGSNYWMTVEIQNTTAGQIKEVTHVLASDKLNFCIVKNGSTTPFISSLELRLLSNNSYVSDLGSLETFVRIDIGATVTDVYRFNEDAYDRVWVPFNNDAWKKLSTPLEIATIDSYKEPQLALRTAATPINESEPMNITLEASVPGTQFFVYMHFSELQVLKANETRVINITYNGKSFTPPFSSSYLGSNLVYSPPALRPLNGKYEFLIYKADNSTLPPFINAMEIYILKDLSKLETNEMEVDAMMNIKWIYGVNKISWQGDPCAPRDYSWEGLGCNYENDQPTITSLNLSSSGLAGEIPLYVSNLTDLNMLDLSNNELTGNVPEFLSLMTSLTVLNLSGNNLNGSIPADLLERKKKGLLKLSIEGNPGLCESNSCAVPNEKKKKSILVPVIAVVVVLFVILAVVAAIFLIRRKKHKKEETITNMSAEPRRAHESLLVTNNRRFSYPEVLIMTNNFERTLGRGGFGIVYHGSLNEGTQVAVKVLSQTSTQGYKEFKTEVELLLRVHHRNLTSLVGYCDDGDKLALIYEFMANGDLKDHLSGKRGNVLSWEGRLRIAMESAQGLEYLHNGCKPHIVHRDIKTTNILLNEHFQAKLADFGLSRSFPIGGGTHVSTVIAGTPGYLDPEYYRTNWLTEKSDVYSFGVVLLEIITNRPVIDKKREKPHISDWVSSMLAGGDIRNIVDLNLKGDFDTNSVWRAAEIAMGCVNQNASRRPTMTLVMTELNECLAAETARMQRSRETDYSNDSVEVSLNFTTELSPGAR